MFFASAADKRRQAFGGKHVLVTGASSGIGRSLALLLAAAGARVSLVARTPARLEDAAADARSLAPGDHAPSSLRGVVAVPCDCSDARTVAEMVSRVERENGAVDFLMNCAGGAHGAYFEDLSPEVAEAQMRLNYYSQLFPTQALFKRMKSSGKGGHIVLTSSLAGLTGVFGYTAYAPAKFALRGLAECVYYEGRPAGIHVTVAYPPDTDTPGYANEKQTMPKEALAMSESTGVFTPDAVAEAILNGVMKRQIRVTVGLDGKMLGIVTAGMAPGASFLECLLMPLMRVVSAFVVSNFNRLIAKHAAKEEDSSEKASSTAGNTGQGNTGQGNS
jgi:3-dehydrosphinganine reductase